MRERLTEPPFQDGVRDTGGKVTLAIHACDKPVIAAINGAAVGIGATMTLAMDIRLASTQARIGFVFGRLGIVPEACSSFFLPRIVGLSKALELIYAADILTADQACAAGLVSSVHSPAELLPEAHRLARAFTRGRSPAGVAMMRRLVYAGAGSAHPIDAHRRESLAMFYASIGDGKEGVAAFLEKRPAAFAQTIDIPDLE
jgi:enoyl-CoA hydratase/carnithine racemase